MKINKKFFSVLFVLPSLGFASLQWQLAGSYMYSDVNGQIQIPNGGQPGTTTIGRPKLSDIGINHDDPWDLQLQVMSKIWGGFLNYQNQQQSGNAALNQSLLTHGTNFPANTLVNSNIKFNLLSAGAFANLNYHQITFRPILAATELQFYYSLASAAQFTDRHFSQATPRIGLEILYPVTEKFNLSLTGLSSIPNLVNLSVYTVAAKGDYTLYQSSHYALDAFTGLAYQQIQFKDNQQVPNDIRLVNWPMVFVGLSVNF